MAKKRKKSKSKSSTPTPMVVKSGVKDYAHSLGYRMSADAIGFLELEVQRLIDVAADRAAYNNRVTITEGDV